MNFRAVLLITMTGFLVLFSSAQKKTQIWRDPTVFAINKEKAHAEFTIYSNKKEALKSLNLANPWHSEFYQSLNGQWEFNWYESVNEVPQDWFQSDTKVNKWDHMPVPGTWQSHGFDRLYYLNKYMPFEFNWDTGNRSVGFREGEIEQSKATGYIPDNAQTVGCYRKWVNLTRERLENKVVLRIGAVESGIRVYVNGEAVGYSQGSLTPAEFDISSS